MTIQETREQDEKRINLIAEVDSTINAVCKKVKDNDVVIEGYAETVKALANLVIARAFL